MPFKEHPYYDGSDRDDWLAGENADEKERLCAFALEQIRRHIPRDYLADRPRPEVNEFLFHPISEHGFRAYIEYFFFRYPGEHSPDNDYWWVIVNCPYAVPPYPMGKREYHMIGFGWYVA